MVDLLPLEKRFANFVLFCFVLNRNRQFLSVTCEWADFKNNPSPYRALQAKAQVELNRTHVLGCEMGL